MKKRNKKYQPKPVKNTLALFDGREPPKQSDAITLKLIYRQIFERVRCGQAEEKDLWAMAAMLEDALAWHEGLVDNTTEYMIKQIVKVCKYRAETGEFRVAQVERAQEAA